MFEGDELAAKLGFLGGKFIGLFLEADMESAQVFGLFFQYLPLLRYGLLRCRRQGYQAAAHLLNAPRSGGRLTGPGDTLLLELLDGQFFLRHGLLFPFESSAAADQVLAKLDILIPKFSMGGPLVLEPLQFPPAALEPAIVKQADGGQPLLS